MRNTQYSTRTVLFVAKVLLNKVLMSQWSHPFLTRSSHRIAHNDGMKHCHAPLDTHNMLRELRLLCLGNIFLISCHDQNINMTSEDYSTSFSSPSFLGAT